MMMVVAIAIYYATITYMPATPVTAIGVFVLGGAMIAVAAAAAAERGWVGRLAYYLAALSYVIGLSYTHIQLIPFYQQMAPPVAWIMPILFIGVMPIYLILMPFVARWTYAPMIYRYIARGRGY